MKIREVLGLFQLSYKALFFIVLIISLAIISFYVWSNYNDLKLEFVKAVLSQPEETAVGTVNKDLKAVTTFDLFETLDQLEEEGKSTVLVFEFGEEEGEAELKSLCKAILDAEHSGFQGIHVIPSCPSVIELWCKPGTEGSGESHFKNQAKIMKMTIVRVAERDEYYRD